MPDDDALTLAARCDNRGRWGDRDQLGTLNHVTPEVRVGAAGLVRTGEVVSLARPLAVQPSAVNLRPDGVPLFCVLRRPLSCRSLTDSLRDAARAKPSEEELGPD